mmetsp:Transcript_19229/g.40332  ORF Transcript_19229/g.40332 Transcript_19229/m.40332 type:complete len:226 (+) Transcript_19229:589-1266(+)
MKEEECTRTLLVTFFRFSTARGSTRMMLWTKWTGERTWKCWQDVSWQKKVVSKIDFKKPNQNLSHLRQKDGHDDNITGGNDHSRDVVDGGGPALPVGVVFDLPAVLEVVRVPRPQRRGSEVIVRGVGAVFQLRHPTAEACLRVRRRRQIHPAPGLVLPLPGSAAARMPSPYAREDKAQVCRDQVTRCLEVEVGDDDALEHTVRCKDLTHEREFLHPGELRRARQL